MRNILFLFALLGFVLSGGACKEKQPAQKKSGKGSGDLQPTPPSPPGPTNPPTIRDDEEEDEEEPKKDCKKKKPSSSSGLRLTAAVNYDDDIKSILDDKCVSCHGSGGTSPDLSTHAKVKSNKTTVKSEIDSGDMPPSGATKLTASEKTKIMTWIEEGMLKSASEGGSEGSEGSTTSSGGADCEDEEEQDDEEEDDEDDTASAWEELINPAKLKECKDKGKIFDRSKDKCHRAQIAESYECTRTGITDKFKAVGVNVTTQFDQLQSDGYEIDQCGEYNNEPIVYFRKKQESDEELKLLIKKICKKGSAACTNE